jgi:hypothetical protein
MSLQKLMVSTDDTDFHKEEIFIYQNQLGFGHTKAVVTDAVYG